MTAFTTYPDTPAGRPIWLVTLADLALLLVGFFVLLQATHTDGGALARGMREGFGVHDAAPLPVAADGIADFAIGSAAIFGAHAGLLAWARDAARDPRVTLTVTGSSDGSAADVDPTTGSGAILAADRARAVAALLAPIAPRRIAIATSTGRRAAIVTLAFAGEPDTGKQP